MEHQLRQLQTLTENLVVTFNEETATYNQMVEELNEKDEYIGNLEYGLTKANELIVKQKRELEELLAVHNREVMTANRSITNFQAETAKLRAELKELKALKPKELAKTNKNQKAALAEKQTLINRLEGQSRNLRRDNDRLRVHLELQRVGEYQLGEERVIPYLRDEDIRAKNMLAVQRNFKHAKWWMHECGLQVLIAYDEKADDLIFANPLDESEKLREPSAAVQQYMLKQLRAADRKTKS